MPEREGLVARIRQIRRASAAADDHASSSTGGPSEDALSALDARIGHLEHLVEGLQDSVHRESTRLSRRVSELESQIEPAALGRALSEDARKRGLQRSVTAFFSPGIADDAGAVESAYSVLEFDS